MSVEIVIKRLNLLSDSLLVTNQPTNQPVFFDREPHFLSLTPTNQPTSDFEQIPKTYEYDYTILT